MKYLHQVVSLLLVFLLVSLTACGGGGGGGSNNSVATLTLSGTVVDSNGVAVPDATVTVTSDPVITQTDANGVFSVRIDAGSHHLSAERNGVVFLDMDITADVGSDLDLGTLTPTTPYVYQSGDTQEPPKFSGFNFILNEQDFWEYRWDYTRKSTTSAGTKTHVDRGRYFVTLGPAKAINGVTAYEVRITGRSDSIESSEMSGPRWKYIAVADHRILGSLNGLTLKVLFDAQKGVWPGSGYFTTFDSGVLFEAKASSIDNAYISESALMVEASESQSHCEYYPGIGSVCGNKDAYDLKKREFYKAELGPIGYLRSINYSFGGTYPQYVTIRENTGLVSTSRRGVALAYTMEDVPNESSAQAQTIIPGSTVFADVERDDAGTVHPGVMSSTVNPDKRLADWYQFTLTNDQTVSIMLTFEDISSTNIESDLDVYLLNVDLNGDLSIYTYSTDDNAADDSPTERIDATLQAGTYYVAVQAFNTPNDRIAYTLEVN